jgi:hypothetical protein
MIIKQPIEMHVSTASPEQFKGILKDIIIGLLNQCGVYKIDYIDFKFRQKYPDTFNDDLVFDIRISKVIVNPKINYDIIIKYIIDNWSEFEKVVRYGY